MATLYAACQLRGIRIQVSTEPVVCSRAPPSLVIPYVRHQDFLNYIALDLRKQNSIYLYRMTAWQPWVSSV